MTLKLDDGWRSLGAQDAPVTLVEFADYQCPFCRAFHTDAFADLKKNFIDAGKVRFISRDLPLDSHANALKAAQAAHCAGEQDKFWEMRDLLILNADKLAPDAISGYAQQLGLELDRFNACTASDRFLDETRKQAAEANSLGISGTPTFVLGKTDGDTLAGFVLVGAQPYSVFETKVSELLPK